MSAIALSGAPIDVAALIAAASIRLQQRLLDGLPQTSQSVPVDSDDQADIQASLGGNGDAYARLVGRYQPALARRLRRFARDRAGLEELVQEVFVQAYFSLRSYKATAPFEHWLNKIATRVGYRYWKDLRRRPALTLESWDSSAADAPAAATDGADAREAAEELQILMEQLAPRDRLVLTLLYLEERTVAQAAELAGWSQSLVKVQAFRARAKLRKLFEVRGHHSLERKP